MVDKEPQSTSKQIQADLQTQDTTVSARTIRRHLSFWENVIWTDETKVELFGQAHYCTNYKKRNEAFKEKKT